ncbi:MAG: aminopeptidase, partial [Burkholderiales bacterium]
MTRKGGMASLFVLLAAMLLNGCASFDYYSQAVSGQIGLDYRARPVIDVLSAPDTPGSIAERLRWAMQIRDFASHTLQLPDNASYRNYVDLQRPYVLWNVVAAPEFSLTARSECFPFAGCVAYRGFF